ncbi:MAG: efflux RND transporter periplasmic adaptor subunit [Proteobacteria bacterium]|nr:efflux RND transporter periplasmic adaptor subunit [Pseudomonadota bacterium]
MPLKIFAVAGLVCCGLLLQACDSEDKEAAAPLTPVRVQVPAVTDLTNAVSYTANIEANSQVNVAFKVNGYVTDLLQEKTADGADRPVQSGDIVKKNAVLAKVDSKDASNSIKETSAQVSSAQANFNKAAKDYERAQALFKSNSMTAPDFDSAKQEYENAVSQLNSAKAQQKTAENDLQDFDLKAPLSGVVLQRNVDIGTLVSPGAVGFVVADTTVMKAVFGVPDTISQGLKVGDPQKFIVQSIPNQEFSGKISEISASADTNSRVFDVKVDVDNMEGLLKVGMIASLDISKEAASHSAALIPLSAIVKAKDDPNGYAVFVLKKQDNTQTVSLQTVELGKVYGNKIDVLGGLTPEDQVVVKGAAFVADGQKVAVIP